MWLRLVKPHLGNVKVGQSSQHPPRRFSHLNITSDSLAAMFSFLYPTSQLLALLVAVCGMPISDVSSQLSAAGGNRTTLRSQIAPAWTSSASYRGTLDIIWSCVLTLTACIYTALHLNISPHTSKQKQLWRKVGWAALTLIAPELVLYIAVEQFIEARDLVNRLNKQRPAKQAKSRV